MGRFADILGVFGTSFGIGPKATRATLDASGLTAARTLTVPDQAGALVVGPAALSTAVTSSSGVLALTASSNTFFTLTITENITAFVSGTQSGSTVYTFALLITQDGTGGHTLALPSAWKALGSSDTAIQSAAGAKTLIVFTAVGQTLFFYSMAKVAP